MKNRMQKYNFDQNVMKSEIVNSELINVNQWVKAKHQSTVWNGQFI